MLVTAYITNSRQRYQDAFRQGHCNCVLETQSLVLQLVLLQLVCLHCSYMQTPSLLHCLQRHLILIAPCRPMATLLIPKGMTFDFEVQETGIAATKIISSNLWFHQKSVHQLATYFMRFLTLAQWLLRNLPPPIIT